MSGLLSGSTALATCGILQSRDGYFWDPASGDYFIPRGFAYQTLNPEVGATQTVPQLEYDLKEFKKMYANSVRLEFVWDQVEIDRGVFDWSKPDSVVALAEKLGLRLFVLIGFNYAPGWFAESWRSTREDGKLAQVVNYEHPEVRTAYSNYVYRVTHQYKEKAVVAAWILGNEFAYFDLWDTNEVKYFLGYDSAFSQPSFRYYLKSRYTNDIQRLNANWGTTYPDFESVMMPKPYPVYRTNTPGYYDLVQWRKQSIGNYVAVAAVAARRGDTNHLLSYSMVGGIFSGNDGDYTCEDAKTIVGCCAAAGAPLDFWAINNYPRAAIGSEQRSADFGVAKYRAQSGLPVLVTETGYSSTEVYGDPTRQAKALPSALWEALVSGALGVHLFTWNDRDLYRGDNKPREQGFGIVNQIRTIKDPVYWNVAAAFRTMENLRLNRLLPGATATAPDIQLFWSRHADMVWPRANQENTMIWGALKRLGYQLGLIDDEQFEAGTASNSPALLLSRCMSMNPAHLDRITTNTIPAGVSVHANGDIPGEFNAYGHANPQWADRMNSLFGLDVSHAQPALDSGVTNISFGTLSLQGTGTLGPFSPAYADGLSSWKIWHGLLAASGTTVVTHKGINNSQSALPALQVKDLGHAKTAINTFALGDTYGGASPAPEQHLWDIRSTWLKAIYRDWFGIVPAIDLSGPGAAYVVSNYRPLANGSVLLLLINEDTNHASVTLSATNLLAGHNVENLTSGSMLATNSTGILTVDLGADDTVLLYAYKSQAGVDASLLNPSPNKLWIMGAPMEVWPTGSNWNVMVAFDLREPGLSLSTSFERVLSPNLVYARTNAGTISGKGTRTIPLPIPGANPQDPWYISSPDGGEYVYHAWLEKGGTHIADTYLPVRLAWPVHILSAPEAVVPGSTCSVTVGWQELPSYLPEEGPAPLDRAALWQLYVASRQYYKVILQLHSGNQVVVTQEFLTNRGTDRHTFEIAIPGGATSPFTWTAMLETAPDASVDVLDSFENRDTGADKTNEPPFLFAPWTRYTYPPGPVRPDFWASGVYTDEASDGRQSAFLIVTNPPDVGPYSGFGMEWIYPESWTLPRNIAEWTNYTVAFDFKEANGLPCVLEMQLTDTQGGMLHKTNQYTAPAGFQTTYAPLDQFMVPDWLGRFDAQNVNTLVLNIQMLQAGAVYHASIDNVRFIGPKTGTKTLAPLDVWDGFDDRAPGVGSASLFPWEPYAYSERKTAALVAANVATGTGLKGGAGAQLMVTNPPDVGAWSGFGMVYTFTNAWSLPTDTNAWANYVFSFSFRETNTRPCILELQVKSDDTNRVEYTATYNPAPDGWDTIRARLREFVTAAGLTFDPKHVQQLAVNIRTLQKGVTYEGYFDNVWFDAPDQVIPSGTPFASLQFTNTVSPDTSFRIESIAADSEGHILLSWYALSNRVYSVYYAEELLPGEACFLPLSDQTNLTVPTARLLRAIDTNAPLSRARFYRISLQP